MGDEETGQAHGHLTGEAPRVWTDVMSGRVMTSCGGKMLVQQRLRDFKHLLRALSPRATCATCTPSRASSRLMATTHRALPAAARCVTPPNPPRTRFHHPERPLASSRPRQTNTTAQGNFPVQQDPAAMRQERQTALKETAELRRELNGGAGPLDPRLAENTRSSTRRWLPRGARRRCCIRRSGANARRTPRGLRRARLATSARKNTARCGEGGGKEARREDLKDRSRATAPTSRDDSTARQTRTTPRGPTAPSASARFESPTTPAPHWKPRRVGEHRDVDHDPDRDASESAHCPRPSPTSTPHPSRRDFLSNGDGSAPPLSAHAPPRRLRTAPHVPVRGRPARNVPSNVPIERTNFNPLTTPRGRERAGWNDGLPFRPPRRRRAGEVDEVESPTQGSRAAPPRRRGGTR